MLIGYVCYRLIVKLKDFKYPVTEDPLATEVFHYLQIMSACFLSFSHGSNDTAYAWRYITFVENDSIFDTLEIA